MFTISEIQEIINSEIKKEKTDLLKSGPENLYLPVNYILELSSKKIRPILVMLSYNMFSDNIKNALPVALGMEIFHNFTLLHDDIMDNADIRRNKQTVHKKFGKNAAILSGDVMSILSFQYILKTETSGLKELLQLFTNTAIEVCEGQQYDMDFENRSDVTEEEYLRMIRLKTAVLLACSLKSGAVLAETDQKVSDILYNAGINLGMAFQLQDDLLDSFGNETTFGKKIGGDILSNKKTYLLIKALELSNQKQNKELKEWINKTDFNPEEKINTFLKIYRDTGIELITKEKINTYFNKAINFIKDIPIENEKKSELLLLSDLLLKRKY